MDGLDLTAAERKATYAELKQHVLGKYGLKVSTKMLSSQTAQRKKKMQ